MDGENLIQSRVERMRSAPRDLVSPPDLQRWLTFEELRDLREKSERLFAAARALVQARRVPLLVGGSQSAAAPVADVVPGEPGEPTEQSTALVVRDQREVAGAETAPPDTP
jgi:hypothetical protein